MYNLPRQQHRGGKDEEEQGLRDLKSVFQAGSVFKDAARALGYGGDTVGSSALASTTAPFTVSPVTLPGTALHSIPHTFPLGLAPRLPDSTFLPPLTYNKPRPEPRTLTQAEVEEIAELRQSDPKTWTISALCKKFGCNFGIVRAIKVNHEAHNAHEEGLKATKSRWGRKKTIARMERTRRKALWERDA
jgi:hypothetical protein